MRPITTMQAQFKMNTQSGTNLNFEQCKGGYFSTLDAYGLKVIGKTAQAGIPTPENPVEIQCVKAGTRVFCGESGVVVPCDLYEGDSWYPMTGKVIKTKATKQLTANDGWAYYTASCNRAGVLVTDMILGTIGRGLGYCNIAKNNSNWNGNYLQCFFGAGNNLFYLTLATSRGTTLEEFKQVIQSVYDNGGEVRIVYTLKTPVIEQYDPQFISAPQGTVSVTQVPTELTAELSATMLVRR